ncbi:MAG: UDP-N-acetylmuramoyl-tripeptide--D-alanyl-D-alanine ligase, partial [Actinomycetales bacterium]|nr:UDP-N-acetylmuramoyl-tripeptide--D-alanyl-D-alanine ligase [Actinomycetales bacterium]
MTRRDPQWDTSRLAEVLSLSQPEHCVHFSGFSTDTRTMAPGQVFIALRGERVDGHDFVEQAHARGAAAIVVDHDMPPPGCMVVPDTLRAYAAIAADHLRSLRPGLTVVAVTGSSGKTSTKDLMTSVFGAARRTVAAEGSLNNEVGLPATVLAADGETQVLVLEMGMRGLGHIAYLCHIAPPDISLVLNVGSAHIGELGSREAIAAAKSEIVVGARPGATSVLNADDPLVSAMAAMAPGPVLMFGQAAAADVRATDVALSAEGAATFRLHLPQSEPQSVALQVLGRHQVMNALAAAAAAHA